MLRTTTLHNHHCPGAQLTLQPGNVLAIYTDTGPRGPCGQSASITCAHTKLYWFPNVQTFRDHQSELGRDGRQANIEYCVIGEYASGSFELIRYYPDPETNAS